jgi:hypothetical protein
MYLPKLEPFRTLIVDPGEMAGWSTSCGRTLIAAGQEKLWLFADQVWTALVAGEGDLAGYRADNPFVIDDENAHLLDLPIKRIVFENFRLYPAKASQLAWDEFRTVRLIGALCFMARVHGIEIFDQPASIKEAAEVGGAEAFFLRPLHENRHANDSLRHWWYFCQFGPEGNPSVPNRGSDA